MFQHGYPFLHTFDTPIEPPTPHGEVIEAKLAVSQETASSIVHPGQSINLKGLVITNTDVGHERPSYIVTVQAVRQVPFGDDAKREDPEDETEDDGDLPPVA